VKLFVVTDLEGVTGIVDWDKHMPDDNPAAADYHAYVDFLMTNDVNGAVEGAFAAGAEQVWVAESHKIDIRQIHPDAILHKSAAHKMTPALLGMQKGKWDAAAFIGNHCMAETKGTLSHTQNQRVKSIHLNGLLVGEFGIQAAIAGDFGMPMILVSGDDEACRQARELIPDIETAVVKHSTSRHSAWCLSPVKARALIAEKMQAAVRRWHQVKPFVVRGPVVIREELYDGMVREAAGATVAEAFERRCEMNV
jgi:D-amino peptidase